MAGAKTTFGWDTSTAPYTLTSITDSANNTLNYSYNSAGQVTQVTDGLASDNTETVTYQTTARAGSCGGRPGDWPHRGRSGDLSHRLRSDRSRGF